MTTLIDRFLNQLAAEEKSPETLSHYREELTRFEDWLGEHYSLSLTEKHVPMHLFYRECPEAFVRDICSRRNVRPGRLLRNVCSAVDNLCSVVSFWNKVVTRSTDGT